MSLGTMAARKALEFMVQRGALYGWGSKPPTVKAEIERELAALINEAAVRQVGAFIAWVAWWGQIVHDKAHTLRGGTWRECPDTFCATVKKTLDEFAAERTAVLTDVNPLDINQAAGEAHRAS